TSRSFWRYWVSAIGKFIPKSGAECRPHHLKNQFHPHEMTREGESARVNKVLLGDIWRIW
ncbi:hypothetical protein ACK3Y9_15940, partial [Aeromonas caviae]